MKKFSLKVKELSVGKLISIVFLIMFALTWVIKTATVADGKITVSGTSPLGLLDLVRIPFGTAVNFIHIGLLIVVIGGFYGILNETGVYSKIVKKSETLLSKNFLVISMIVLILLSSMMGVNFLLFALVPFIATVLFRLGYDKITVMAATIGSILVGNVGAVYSSYVNTPLKWFLQLDVNSQILFKVVALAAMSLLYIMYVVSKANKKKVSKKELEIPLYEEKVSTKKSIVPLVIILIIGILFSLVAMYDWLYTWDIAIFQEFHENLPTLTVFGYPLFSNLLGSGNFLGSWTIYDLTILLAIMSVLITWIYGIKTEVAINKFVDGAKKMVKPAFFVIMSNIVFYAISVTQASSNISYNIFDMILDLNTGFNMFITMLGTIIGSIFYMDFTQFASTFSSIIRINIVNTSVYPVISLIMQFIHGLMMFILPTSSMLVLGLIYFNVSFKEWISYIWKILLQLTAIALIVIILSNMFI